MNTFDIAAILITIAAASGYLNHRLLRLPVTSGTLLMALLASLVVVAIETAFPALNLQEQVAAFLARIDFNQALMNGMLCFVLFAAAIDLDLEGQLANRGVIIALATVGVLISTAVTGLLTWWIFNLIGADVTLLGCLLFGALISPTDPIAVMALLKELGAPKNLEAQIAGESLFNDGVGVVVFLGLLSMLETSGAGSGASAAHVDAASLGIFFGREVFGGVFLGLGLGYIGYRLLLSIDEHGLELLITIALAMFVYAASFWVHVSGPIATVMAGLLIGNPGRRFAMSARTREHIDAFWSMIDEILNAVLFLLLGLELFLVPGGWTALTAGMLAVPITLLARLVSVAVPVAAMRVRVRGLVPILTWSGLRGGISIAMALSLPTFPHRDLLLTCTYAVVVFSILVQGLTVRRVLVYYGIGRS